MIGVRFRVFRECILNVISIKVFKTGEKLLRLILTEIEGTCKVFNLLLGLFGDRNRVHRIYFDEILQKFRFFDNFVGEAFFNCY